MADRDDTMKPSGESGAVRPSETPVQEARFADLRDQPIGDGHRNLEFLRDVEVELTAELGSARMRIKHILGLRPGSVVELDRLAGEPVELTINKTLIARGEVVVVDEKFAVRITEIVSPEKRLGGGGNP